MAEPQIPRWANFILGGLSGMMAASVVHPADLVKTRMQLLGPRVKLSTATVVKRIVKKEGFIGFYSGLSASLVRQATYTAGRMGCFYSLLDLYKGQYGTPNFVAKLGLASMAGSVGAVIGNPAEIALIRMTADGQMPPEKRRNYKNVIDALFRIVREEGLMALFRGVESTVTRSAIVNAAQLGGYAQAREMLLPSMGEGIGLHFASAVISGFITTIVFLPVDIVKTRVQNASVPTSQVKVLFKIIKNEGPLNYGLASCRRTLGSGHKLFSFSYSSSNSSGST
ncbi:PREDICTED: mitochondrial 2-oxoglutarate/malate carrier protein-like isoform X2 [Papilio polytes]|uniref:mitochondrial 2-oxoglutarate/malate carrier protein-like isoform X2 n=1 Tax=Papilio polytes TaxID=76194 RepID=UPI000675D825|nr:PREDICTED: mitochondrial 2-oxoglutarate/malate carrier protein-like isoform X2 [Papilio polytes]